LTTNAPDTAEALAHAVRQRLWRYLAASAEVINFAPVVEGLLRLPRGDLRRLAATHLAVRAETSTMLDDAERLLKELPSSATRVAVEAVGAIRPPVSWSETVVARTRTGQRHMFICRPALRRYDTPLARMLKLALTRVAALQELSELEGGGPIVEALERVTSRANRLRHHTKLEDVTSVETVSASTSRLAIRHSAGSIPDFLDLYVDAIEHQAPAAVFEVVSTQLLSPQEVERLFELYVGFELIDGLRDVGFREAGMRLLPGTRSPFAKLRRRDVELEIWWQTPIWRFFEALADASEYRQALEQAGLRYTPLRPDFIVIDRSRRSALIVEVKFTSVEDGQSPDRRGVQDALMYLRDAMAIMEALPLPHALVAGWKSKATPRPHRVVVCDQETVRDGIQIAVDSWQSFGTPR